MGKFVVVSLESGAIRGAIFAAVGRARLCEIRNIAGRRDGVSPRQSKLAYRERRHGRLRRGDDQLPRLDRLRAEGLPTRSAAIGAANRMSI